MTPRLAIPLVVAFLSVLGAPFNLPLHVREARAGACDVAFRSASSQASANSGDISVVMPAGTVEDDIMIMEVYPILRQFSVPHKLVPAGW
jgi:hypothetical protein